MDRSRHAARPWARRLWIVSGMGAVIAVAPLAFALLGLLFENQYLATYHWLLYFSAPIGIPIALLAGLPAIVMTARELINRGGKSNIDEDGQTRP